MSGRSIYTDIHIKLEPKGREYLVTSGLLI